MSIKKLSEEDSYIAAENEASLSSVSKDCILDVQDNKELVYGINDAPRWYFCLLLAIQHSLTIFAMSLMTPFFFFDEKKLGSAASMKGDIYCTTLFGLGISSFLQVTFGSRLPLVQGIATEYTVSLLPFMFQTSMNRNASLEGLTFNSTEEEDKFIWTNTMRKFQGAVIIAGILEFLIGFSGLVSLIRKLVTPVVLCPCLVLIGLMLVEPAANLSAKHWGISILTIGLAIIFSQYLQHCQIPCWLCCYCCKKQRKKKIRIFKMLPIILAILISWIVCAIITVSGGFPDKPQNSSYGYFGRTDIRSGFIRQAPWVRGSYPGQWGTPIFSLPAIIAIIPPLFSSIIDSFGEYFGCANLCSIPPPPNHSINRGIAVEGIGGIICGLLGFGSNTTTVGTNLGLIGLTRVASRRVIQLMSCLLILVSFSGKVGALFLTLPDPVIGGALCVGMGMLIGAGLANLKDVDLASKRNLFILGFSIFVGVMLPQWCKTNEHLLKSGSSDFDNILKGLIVSPMFVGGFLALFLENTIPGKMVEKPEKFNENVPDEEVNRSYKLPFSTKLNSITIFQYFPICPSFKFHFKNKKKSSLETVDNNDSILLQKVNMQNGSIH